MHQREVIGNTELKIEQTDTNWKKHSYLDGNKKPIRSKLTVFQDLSAIFWFLSDFFGEGVLPDDLNKIHPNCPPKKNHQRDRELAGNSGYAFKALTDTVVLDFLGLGVIARTPKDLYYFIALNYVLTKHIYLSSHQVSEVICISFWVILFFLRRIEDRHAYHRHVIHKLT